MGLELRSRFLHLVNDQLIKAGEEDRPQNTKITNTTPPTISRLRIVAEAHGSLTLPPSKSFSKKYFRRGENQCTPRYSE
jgi:hypothetical protein